MDPHYTRANMQRKLLGSNLNINKMYNLYKEEQKGKSIIFVKLGVYTVIFFARNSTYHFISPKRTSV